MLNVVGNDTLSPIKNVSLRPGDMRVLAILPDIIEAELPGNALLRLVAQEGLTITEIGVRLRFAGAPRALTRPAGVYPALLRLEAAGLIAGADPSGPGAQRANTLNRRRYWRTSIGSRQLSQ